MWGKRLNKMQHLFQSELLAPAGGVDSLRAAIRAGANAIYLGLRQFNARARASNFQEAQLAAVMKEAKAHGVKIYITVNTVIKNTEINQLLHFLATLEANKVDAIIIQDFGVLFLAKKYFPNLPIHASTQMANHNSLGVEYSSRLGFERCVLARELTMCELETIAQKASCELEVFIHGALCYSFSGMCFFSSYIGGRGANRGMCSQACRMEYKKNSKLLLPFNLKDNQQLTNVLKLQELGVHSLKIEGRMKSAEYVHRVTKAYRSVLDGEKQEQAEQMLMLDFGRSKTGYFLNNNLKQAIADNSNTGIYLGRVQLSDGKRITFESKEQLQEGDRLRIQKKKSKNTINLRAEDLSTSTDGVSCAKSCKETISNGDQVFLIGRKEESFPSRLMNVPPLVKKASAGLQQQVKQALKPKVAKKGQPETYLRIDTLDWLEFIRAEELDGIILSLKRRELEQLNWERKFLQKHKQKIFIELPKFIGEEQIPQWQLLISKAYEQGFQNFSVSHLSQKLMLPRNCTIMSNEQVYVFNDAAAKFAEQEVGNNYCYPLENDWKNLSSLQCRAGIVVLHSRPELFYSRMPIGIKDSSFEDSFGAKYITKVEEGITIVCPDKAVNLMSFKDKMLQAGFSRFLLDIKHEEANASFLKELFVHYKKGRTMPNAVQFNFDREMK